MLVRGNETSQRGREKGSKGESERVRLGAYLTKLAWANGPANTPLGYPSREVTHQVKANLRVPVYIVI